MNTATSTKYEKQRFKIFTDLRQFLLSKSSFTRKSVYSASNLKLFTIQHSYATKHLVLTHLSEGLSTLSNFGDNLLMPKIQVDLKNRPDFRDVYIKKKSTKNSQIRYLIPEHFLKLLKQHDIKSVSTNSTPNDDYFCSGEIHACRAMFQLFVGVRVENSWFDPKMKWKFEVSQHGHENRPCENTNLECYHIYKTETKTSAEECFYVHPIVFNCMNNLIKYAANFQKTSGHKFNPPSMLHYYNKWIKEHINSSFASHSIRKTLPNFCDTNNFFTRNNTGAWRTGSAHSAFNRSYVHPTSKITYLANFINNIRNNKYKLK